MTVRQQGRTAAARRRTATAGPPPVFGAAGTNLTGATRTSTAFPVPSGVTAGQVVLVHMYLEVTTAVTPPAGFTEVTFSPSPATSTHMQRLFWKRATGADSGTYTFTHASTWSSGIAERYTGCLATGTPLEVLGSAARDSGGTVTPAVSGTTGGPNRLLVFTGSSNDGSSTWTPPTGYTGVLTGPSELTTGYKTQATAGATGSVTATATGYLDQTATLVGLLPA